MKIPCVRLIPACLLMVLPGTALSAEVSVDTTSIVRIEQRADKDAPKKDIAPATQFLGLDVANMADGNLSFHAYGWGRADIGEKSFNNNRYDGSLTYGYLQYRFKAANADTRAGRFFIHEGIVNEQIDGVSLRTDLPLGFGISAFGGANVHTQNLPNENSDGKGAGNFGGRLNYRYKGVLELGVSGQYETKAPTLTSTLGDGVTPRFKNGNHRNVGGDVWFSPHKSVELMGHTSYNTETKGVAENSYLMNVRPIQHLMLTGEYNEYNTQNNFYTWVTFLDRLQLNDSSKSSHSIGGLASYDLNNMINLSVDYKHYTRDSGNADRYGGDIKLSFLDNAVRSGLGYHYLDAGKEFAIAGTGNTNGSYHALRAYTMHDTKTYFASLDVIDYIFKQKVDNTKSAWEAMASLGYHITPALAVSGDLSYGRNPQLREEIKGLVRLTYNSVILDSKGGKK